MKKNIAVVVGGNSSEYFISLQSGEKIANEIDKEKFNVYVVTIKGSDWELTSDLYCGLIINKNDFSFNDNGKKVKFDCAYIAIHGTPGEDGKLQSYFDMIKLPYTSCNVLCSALTFNKYYCNTVLRQSNINIANSVLLIKGQNIDNESIISKTGLPCFVKPNEGGSSFGISKVKKQEDLISAIEIAFKESNQVIIEQFIEGTEITVGLVKTKNKDYIFTPIEIVSANEFFDYEAKYNDKKTQEIIPARISAELTKKSQELSSQIYDYLNCSGIVRVDFILKNDTFYFLEINTIPGMTAASLVPKQIKEYGVEMKDLLTDIIENSINTYNL
ncbi:MAG: D-alanine--D-alanine ligase [Bacteroidales bacterium]|nr:D-alanine--D-alanine ligase [Bacteroidales bacterium]MBN2756582.1 D-alanine--D-alanine ligase [Bacteroidales bacterium]